MATINSIDGVSDFNIPLDENGSRRDVTDVEKRTTQVGSRVFRAAAVQYQRGGTLQTLRRDTRNVEASPLARPATPGEAVAEDDDEDLVIPKTATASLDRDGDVDAEEDDIAWELEPWKNYSPKGKGQDSSYSPSKSRRSAANASELNTSFSSPSNHVRIMRPGSQGLPGIEIDDHQRKHFLLWPSIYPGGSGTQFPRGTSMDDFKQIATWVIDQCPMLNSPSSSDTRIRTMQFEVEDKRLGKYASHMSLNAAYDPNRNVWDIHIFPSGSGSYKS